MTSSWRWWLALTAVAGVVLYALSSVLLPFVAGMVVAYFLNPLLSRLQLWGMSRSLGTVIILLLFFALGGVALAGLLPRVESQVADAVRHLPEYRQSLETRLGPLVQDYLSSENLAKLQTALGEHAGDVAGWALQAVAQVLRGGLAVMDVLSLLFIMPIVTFYLMRDWTVLVAKVDAWLPRHQAPVIAGRMAEIDDILSAFVRGQALVCVVLASYYGAALSLVGVDLGLVIGLLTGLLSFVPYLGMLTGLMVSLGLAFAQTGTWAMPAAIAVVFAIGHLTESNVLTPRLVGERIGLHPLWIMFALMAGGALLGFVGVLLAVPVAAVIGVVLRYALSRYLVSALYDDGTVS